MAKKTLAELRAASASQRRRPRASVRVCLAPDILADVQELTRRLEDLDLQAVAGPGRLGSGKGASQESDENRAAREDLQQQLRAKLEEMAEHEGDMWVEATRERGEWRRWVEAHPMRGEDDPQRSYDLAVAAGHCNADDLLDDLGTYVVSYNGEDLQPGDWEQLTVGSADQKDLANAVVGLYEGGAQRLPNLRSDLSKTLKKWISDESRTTSGSRGAGSSGGSRKRSTSTSTRKGK